MSRCKGCGAEIVWALTVKANMMPVDAVSSPDGNVRLFDDSARAVHAEVLGPLERQLAMSDGETLHMPHHATCPKVGDFR